MIATLSKDMQTINLKYSTENELLQTQAYFRRKVKNYIFLRKKYKNWNGDVNYLTNNDTIKATMWSRLVDMCDKYGFQLDMVGFENFIRENIKYEHVEKFCKLLLQDHAEITPYPDQIDAVYKAIKYRYSCLEIATSGGKTLIIYMYMMALRYFNMADHVMIITPDPNLTIQNYSNFVDYACGKYELKMGMIHGNSKDKKQIDKFNHIVGNFASLANLPEDYFQKFDTIICDEAHRAVASTIQTIIKNCGEVKNLMGCSGSFVKNKGDADEFTVEQSFGPIVKIIKKKDLIEKGQASDITIKMIDITFCSQEELIALASEKDFIDDGEKALRFEQQFIRNNRKLLEWKCQFISRLKGNTIVYFIDKKGNYGRKIYDRLNDINFAKSLGKKIFYIDGDTPVNDREIYKDLIRNDTTGNSILVANYGVFSTGQSINNLINIVTAESVKSDILLNQSSGRLLRMTDGKEMSYFYDIIENTNVRRLNLSTNKYENKRCFMWNWSKSRLDYYKSEGLKVEMHQIDISRPTISNRVTLDDNQTLF